MSWRDAVNAAFQRTTGYVLTRETPEQRHEALQEASRQAAAQARQELAEKHRREIQQRDERDAQRRAQRRKAAEEAKARRAAEREARLEREAAARREHEAHERARMLAMFDEELCATVDRVLPETMTSPIKIATLIEATRYVVRNRVPGAVVECGVWRGGSMQAVALTLLALGDSDRELHLFDTFEGMPEPSERDRRHDGEPAADILARSPRTGKTWAVAGLEDVRAGMAETGYPGERIHFHPGRVEQTIPAEAPEQIAILRLDTDWYESTRHELEHLYARVPAGGVVLIDDYGYWEGARQAVDEFLARTGERLLLVPMASGRIAVKP
jgi:O-methyltransferase